MMSELKPGWVNEMPAVFREQDEVKRSEGLGLQPRRAWRTNADVKQASRMRGARALKRALPPLDFPEDGTDVEEGK